MPRFELSDLPRPPWGVVMTAIGVCWLVGRALTTGLGGSLGEFDVMGVVLALFVPVALLLGPRTIVVDDAGIRVTRRGRVVLERRMDEVAGIRGLWPASRLVFVDGAWLLWFISGRDWGPPTDFIVSRLAAGPTAQAGVYAATAGRLRLPADRIRFPPGCLGCGAAPEFLCSLTVRRGFDLGFAGFFVARGVAVPACADCDDRRRGLGMAVAYGPIAGIVGCMFIPLLTPIKGTPVMVLAGALVVLFFALRNRGDEWADAWVWRVRGRLAVDGTVELRVRDAALRAAIAEASRAGPVASADAPRLEV